ncbi:efflux RND transporter periplasmic adaptor subunit [Nitrogeniibacter mangrovi]|uniref:Efflux RND transporter periplasmic adaptor subunit n=1 Tax=Nitrogeniibacter mangrovi TaxID=2016596 RepID=A0A6C1B5S6_9RHOO|nr:efflux RND transporter periplasmic adaptor subunit [Nitrogeniibacter mangrovi]QID18817.1 efflux RND transporter periplasmic adaptor subunit [Nitrogeniibacter mangrovi]
MRTQSLRPQQLAVVASLALLALSACSEKSGAQGGPGGGAPKPAVSVTTVHSAAVPVVTELPGRTSPYLEAEIRPQVTGILQKRLFKEGSTVKAGAPLYQIDPATYRAAVESAKAALARAEATLGNARLTARRYTRLAKVEAISAQTNEDAQAALKQAEADVAAAKAKLNETRINLDYTHINAPISGHIGRSSVTPGALLTANQASALATISQLDPIYVDLSQSTTELRALRLRIASGKVKANTATVPVSLVFEDGSEYAHAGKLAFSEVTVNKSTGSVTLRAEFPNPDGELLPGMFVRARLQQGEAVDAFLVPHEAVVRDARGQPQVMIVDADSKVAVRPITAERSVGDAWVVTDGLKSGDRVIVAGLQKVRPGAVVNAQPADAEAPAAGAAAGAK